MRLGGPALPMPLTSHLAVVVRHERLALGRHSLVLRTRRACSPAKRGRHGEDAAILPAAFSLQLPLLVPP